MCDYDMRAKDLKRKPIQKSWHKCEWCEGRSVNRISCEGEYSRYSCNEHYEKTRRLVMLDGRDDTLCTMVYKSDGFEVRP
jgi:hypothetical protein